MLRLRFTTSILTLIEAERAFIRAERLGHSSTKQTKKMRTTLNTAKSEWIILSLNEAVQRQSVQHFPVEPIRTLDALHLASAVVMLAAFPDLKVLTFDQRIVENARFLKLL